MPKKKKKIGGVSVTKNYQSFYIISLRYQYAWIYKLVNMGLSSSVHHLFLVSEPFSDNHPLCFLFVICSFSFRHLSFSYLPFSVIRCRGWSLLSVCEKLFIIKMASIRQIYGYHTDWKKCNNFRYQETVSFHSPTKSCQEANS